MSSPKLILSPEAALLYHDTVSQARASHFLFWETAARSEAEQWVTDTFYEAAGVHEWQRDGHRPRDRYLDRGEAQLAIAALNLASHQSGTYQASDARSAWRNLKNSLDTIDNHIAHPENHSADAIINSIIALSTDRADGWRRISDRQVAREIRALFRSNRIENFDQLPGGSLIDSLMVYLSLNEQSGSSDGDIGFTDTLYAGSAIDGILSNNEQLLAYYQASSE